MAAGAWGSGAVEGVPGPLVGVLTYRVGFSFYPCWAEGEPILEFIHHPPLFHRVKAVKASLSREFKRRLKPLHHPTLEVRGFKGGLASAWITFTADPQKPPEELAADLKALFPSIESILVSAAKDVAGGHLEAKSRYTVIAHIQDPPPPSTWPPPAAYTVLSPWFKREVSEDYAKGALAKLPAKVEGDEIIASSSGIILYTPSLKGRGEKTARRRLRRALDTAADLIMHIETLTSATTPQDIPKAKQLLEAALCELNPSYISEQRHPSPLVKAYKALPHLRRAQEKYQQAATRLAAATPPWATPLLQAAAQRARRMGALPPITPREIEEILEEPPTSILTKLQQLTPLKRRILMWLALKHSQDTNLAKTFDKAREHHPAKPLADKAEESIKQRTPQTGLTRRELTNLLNLGDTKLLYKGAMKQLADEKLVKTLKAKRKDGKTVQAYVLNTQEPLCLYLLTKTTVLSTIDLIRELY